MPGIPLAAPLTLSYRLLAPLNLPSLSKARRCLYLPLLFSACLRMPVCFPLRMNLVLKIYSALRLYCFCPRHSGTAPNAPPVFLADFPEDFDAVTVRCEPFVRSGRFRAVGAAGSKAALTLFFFVPPPNNPPILSLPNFSAIPENIFLLIPGFFDDFVRAEFLKFLGNLADNFINKCLGFFDDRIRTEFAELFINASEQ